MEFSRQEHWSGLPFPSPGDHPNPGIEPGFSALQADSLPTELPRNLTVPFFATFTLSFFFFFFFFSMFRLVALFSNLVISFKLLSSSTFSLKACALYVPWCLYPPPFFLALTCSMQNLSSLTREPVPLWWKLRVSNTGPPGKSLSHCFLTGKLSMCIIMLYS